MPGRLQLAVPDILEQTLAPRLHEQHQYFFVDSTLADGDPQMRVRLAKTISWSSELNEFIRAFRRACFSNDKTEGLNPPFNLDFI